MNHSTLSPSVQIIESPVYTDLSKRRNVLAEITEKSQVSLLLQVWFDPGVQKMLSSVSLFHSTFALFSWGDTIANFKSVASQV